MMLYQLPELVKIRRENNTTTNNVFTFFNNFTNQMVSTKSGMLITKITIKKHNTPNNRTRATF
jgi:hypothetical protein